MHGEDQAVGREQHDAGLGAGEGDLVINVPVKGAAVAVTKTLPGWMALTGNVDLYSGATTISEGIFELEPMCMLTTVEVSSHAAKNGSQ